MGNRWTVLRNWKYGLFSGSDFSGTSSRSEFWHFFLVNQLIILPMIAVALVVPPVGIFAGVYFIYSLLPSTAVLVRRLHDANYNPWFALLVFVPLGNLAVLYMLCQPSAKNPNKPVPKKVTETQTVVTRSSSPIRANKADEDLSFECGECASWVPGDANFCPSCGTSFADDGYDCSYCGAEINIDASFCPSCGEAFQQ